MLYGICKKWFSLILISLVSSVAFGQYFAEQHPISVKANNLPLSELLELISKQIPFSFSYNPERIPLQAIIKHEQEFQQLDQALNYLASNYHLEFKLVEKQIILRPSPDLPPLEFIVSGYIADARTGEALIGTTIAVDGINIGAATNGYGYFSVSLPYGTHTLQTSYLGYEQSIYTIELTQNERLNFNLKETAPELKEVVVQGFSPTTVEQLQTGKVVLSPKAILEVPFAFGEKDIIKALVLVPGITLQSEGSTFFYARGGNKDQNLILIDDAPIYNPTHIFGLFSSIVPDAINSIDVYTSDFPLSKGGRLSSVIDIKTKEGNKNNFSVWGNIGLISTQIGIEGPFKKEKSSYILAGRLSRIKWIFKQDNPDLEEFQFYDLTGKVNFTLNERNRLYFSFYTGGDSFLNSLSGLSWLNANGSVRWNNLIGDYTFLNTTVYSSNYEYLLHLDRTSNEFWRSRIGEFGLKTDFKNFKNSRQELSWGFNINGRTINPGNLVREDSIAVPDEFIVSVKNNLETSAYAQHEYKGVKWGIKSGIRASLWTSFGEAFEFIFNENGLATDTIAYNVGQAYNNYFQLEPRITTSFFINTKSSIKASYGRSVQNLHLLTNSISPFTSFEVWLPSGPNIRPQQADQFTLGYYYFLANTGVSLQMETYYKIMYNQIDYAAHASTLLNPTIESVLIVGSARGYGIEFLAQKHEGRIRGMVGYTYSKVRSQFAEINNGTAFNAFSDRPNHLNINVTYDIGLRVTLGTNFNFTSGLPFSSPTSFYNFDGNEVPIYEFRNNDRFPAYHRLDLSAKFILNKNLDRSFRHSLTVSIYNLYGRKNPVFINFNKSITIDNNFVVPTNLIGADRTSTQTFLYGVTPSLSYQFKF